MAPRGPLDRRALAAALGLALGMLLLYAPVRGHPFDGYDTPFYLTANPVVQRGLSLDGVRWAFTTAHFAEWRPLTWLSHMLDVELFGMDAGAHHLVSAGMHALTAGLLLLWLARTTGSTAVATIVAALFAAHPLRVEAVAWAAQRREVLAGLFGVATLLAWSAFARRPSVPRYALAALLLACGLMSKPTLVTWPAVLLLADGWPLGRWRGLAVAPPPQRGHSSARTTAGAGADAVPVAARSFGALLVEKLPLLLLVAASALVTFLTQQAGRALELGSELGPGSRLANAALSCVAYLGDTLWPAGLAVFYPHPGLLPGGGPDALPAAAAVALLAALTTGAWWLRRRAPAVLVGWLWFLVVLLPMSGLVQVGAHARADRYTYLPSIGLLIAVVYGADRLVGSDRRRRLGAAALAIAATAACAAATRVQLTTWRDDVTLWRHALAVTEGNFIAHYNLGVELQEDPATSDEALRHLRAAVELRPTFAGALTNLGRLLHHRGELAQAEALYRRALAHDESLASAHGNLGLVLLSRGQPGAAQASLERALELEPASPVFANGLGLVLRELGQDDRAAAAFERSIAAAPGFSEPLANLGRLLLQRGDRAAARPHLERALALWPGHPEACLDLGRLCLLEGDRTAAIELGQRALRARPGWAEAEALLAEARAE